MKQALQKHKYSPVREANDYAVLSKALVKQGKAEEALAIVADAQKTFKDEHSAIVFAATESVAHRAAGNHPEAAAALKRAMAHDGVHKLSAQTVVSLADACFAMGREDDAHDLLRHAIQNNHEDDTLKRKVHDVLTAAGKDPSEATAMIEESTRQVIQLNNDGVLKAQSGQLAQAIELLCQAANRLPNNLQIVSNAALVIALSMVRNGQKTEDLAQCLHYRNALVNKSPNHPKLAQIDSLLKQLTQ